MKKTKNNLLFIIGLFSLFLLLGACAEEQETAAPSQNGLPQGQQQTENADSDEKGPWSDSLYMATSSDGLTFTEGTFVLEHASVSNLLLTSSGQLILIYQFFSPEDESMFDIIAYSLSEDNGKTWSSPVAVTFENLPEPIDSGKVPMDPTLVETENGALRLYFTYHEKGAKTATLYSATAADGKVTSSFVAEQTPALTADGPLLIHMIDPAIVFFDGKWHHYTWQESNDNYHSVSDDGLFFNVESPITLPMDFLGQVITVEDGLRFYGSVEEGKVVSAFSEDGYVWEMDEGYLALGHDPGIAQLEDGTYIMIYTGPGTLPQN